MQTPADKALVDINNAWNELAPKADHGHIWRLVSEARADGITDPVKLCKIATGSLYDGLAYGNWPSAVKTFGK